MKRGISAYCACRNGRAVEYVLVIAAIAGLVAALPSASLWNVFAAMFAEKAVSAGNAAQNMLR